MSWRKEEKGTGEKGKGYDDKQKKKTQQLKIPKVKWEIFLQAVNLYGPPNPFLVIRVSNSHGVEDPTEYAVQSQRLNRYSQPPWTESNVSL